MTECYLCEKKGGIYDFGRNCCRVRYLLSEPRRMVRQAWLIRWTTQLGREAAKETEAAVLERWQSRGITQAIVSASATSAPG